jgi:hypothetical protein
MALSEAVATELNFSRDLTRREDLYISAEELALKLREGWASSNKNCFLRYKKCNTSVLCVVASEFNRMSNRVALTFREDREAAPYARKLDQFFKTVCENPKSQLRKEYAGCSRYNMAIHSLITRLYCTADPTQACVFI